MAEIQIVAWFGGDPITVLSIEGTDKVVYSIADDGEGNRTPLIWHDCDNSMWLGRGVKPEAARESAGFTPAGVEAHTVVSLEPLHLEPSVYWPDCCGLHGFIREGRWIPA